MISNFFVFWSKGLLGNPHLIFSDKFIVRKWMGLRFFFRGVCEKRRQERGKRKNDSVKRRKIIKMILYRVFFV